MVTLISQYTLSSFSYSSKHLHRGFDKNNNMMNMCFLILLQCVISDMTRHIKISIIMPEPRLLTQLKASHVNKLTISVITHTYHMIKFQKQMILTNSNQKLILSTCL